MNKERIVFGCTIVLYGILFIFCIVSSASLFTINGELGCILNGSKYRGTGSLVVKRQATVRPYCEQPNLLTPSKSYAVTSRCNFTAAQPLALAVVPLLAIAYQIYEWLKGKRFRCAEICLVVANLLSVVLVFAAAGVLTEGINTTCNGLVDRATFDSNAPSVTCKTCSTQFARATGSMDFYPMWKLAQAGAFLLGILWGITTVLSIYRLCTSKE